MKLKDCLIKENYYRSELEKLEPSSDDLISVKFTQNGRTTKFMNLNKESIPEMIKFLKYVNEKNKNNGPNLGPPNVGN